MRRADATDWAALSACFIAAGLIVAFVGWMTRDRAAMRVGACLFLGGVAGLLLTGVFLPGGRRGRRRRLRW